MKEDRLGVRFDSRPKSTMSQRKECGMKGWFFTAFLLVSGRQFLSAGEGYADLVSRLQNSVVHIQTTVEVEERRSPFFDPFGFFNDENQEPRRRMQRGAGWDSSFPQTVSSSLTDTL